MNKSNKYLRTWANEVLHYGKQSKNTRTVWSDGTPAHYKSIHLKTAEYKISNNEFPINTLRPTALRSAFYELSWFYQTQSNKLSDLHPSVHPWWVDFVVNKDAPEEEWHIGQTYGHTVRRYDLMNNCLNALLNPDNRRAIINLWDNQQMFEDPKALVPCCYLTQWFLEPFGSDYIKLKESLSQRSMDALMTHSINPTQYTMFGMMIASHLTWATGIKHELTDLKHNIGDYHIYDRHLQFVPELLERSAFLDAKQPVIKLDVVKNFYDITWEDFEIVGYEKPQPLSGKLEIAI